MEIFQRDQIITENETLLAKKDNLIGELQIKLESKDVDEVLWQPINLTPTQQSTIYIRRKVCATKYVGYGALPTNIPTPAWVHSVPKKKGDD